MLQSLINNRQNTGFTLFVSSLTQSYLVGMATEECPHYFIFPFLPRSTLYLLDLGIRCLAEHITPQPATGHTSPMPLLYSSSQVSKPKGASPDVTPSNLMGRLYHYAGAITGIVIGIASLTLPESLTPSLITNYSSKFKASKHIPTPPLVPTPPPVMPARPIMDHASVDRPTIDDTGIETAELVPLTGENGKSIGKTGTTDLRPSIPTVGAAAPTVDIPAEEQIAAVLQNLPVAPQTSTATGQRRSDAYSDTGSAVETKSAVSNASATSSRTGAARALAGSAPVEPGSHRRKSGAKKGGVR